MRNRGKNRRKESKRKLKVGKTKTTSSYLEEEVIVISKSKKVNTLQFRKRYLILCEGETEEVYIKGLKNNVLLKDKFSAVHIEIISPSNKKKSDHKVNLLDNSLKGMAWEAMKRKRRADNSKNPYDEIWIIIDNDERNSYIISEKTIFLSKAKNVLNQEQFLIFSSFKDAFFLSDRDYLKFLKEEINLSPEKAQSMILLTDKNTLFEDYENVNPKYQFYDNSGKFTYGLKRKNSTIDEKDFDINWKKWLKIAYSCRTFENWLILHFEACKIPFTISKEYGITTENPFNPNNSIHYLWRKFAPKYGKGFESQKGKNLNAYEILRTHPEAKYETEIEAQGVIDKVNTAVLNSFWLRKKMATNLALQANKYYEVNPYITVDSLICNLLEKEISYGEFGVPVKFDGIEITCLWDLETRVLDASITNQTIQSMLFNSSNISKHFKLLQISNSGTHLNIGAEKIDAVINISPSEQGVCKVFFPSFSTGEQSFIVFQNRAMSSFLYFPFS